MKRYPLLTALSLILVALTLQSCPQCVVQAPKMGVLYVYSPADEVSYQYYHSPSLHEGTFFANDILLRQIIWNPFLPEGEEYPVHLQKKSNKQLSYVLWGDQIYINDSLVGLGSYTYPVDTMQPPHLCPITTIIDSLTAKYPNWIYILDDTCEHSLNQWELGYKVLDEVPHIYLP